MLNTTQKGVDKCAFSSAIEIGRSITAMMTYKGYSANIEVDLEAEILFGRVLDINDIVTFQAQTIEEARQEFQNSIDDYLEFCKELGQEPNQH
jgi:predicted HicB family RNase H-like nuclease